MLLIFIEEFVVINITDNLTAGNAEEAQRARGSN